MKNKLYHIYNDLEDKTFSIHIDARFTLSDKKDFCEGLMEVRGVAFIRVEKYHACVSVGKMFDKEETFNNIISFLNSWCSNLKEEDFYKKPKKMSELLSENGFEINSPEDKIENPDMYPLDNFFEEEERPYKERSTSFLKTMLSQSIKKEDYLKCAKIRDELKYRD